RGPRKIERRHRGQADLHLALVHLGLGTLQLVLVATAESGEPGAQGERAEHGGAEAVMVRHAGGDNMVGTASQVALLGALVAVAVALGCDSPARVKPWRHAPDPATVAQNAAELDAQRAPSSSALS